MTDAAPAAADAAWRPSDLELGAAGVPPPPAAAFRLSQRISTIVLAVALGAALIGSPGWERVRDTFFNLDVAVASFPRVLQGLWLNIQVLVVASLGVLVVALLLATLRTAAADRCSSRSRRSRRGTPTSSAACRSSSCSTSSATASGPRLLPAHAGRRSGARSRSSSSLLAYVAEVFRAASSRCIRRSASRRGRWD
jgi:hypothetical protein